MLKPRFYFLALMQATSVFGKGAEHILSNMPEGYYRCLVDLDDLQGFHSAPHFSQYKNVHFLALRECKPLPPVDAVDVGALLDDPEGGDVVQQPQPVQDLPPMPVDVAVHGLGQVVVMPEAPRSVTLGDFTVRFDRHSHSSGLQRGYTHCQKFDKHGQYCIKYSQVVGHGSWRHCAAWLAAWAEAGREAECLTKQKYLKAKLDPNRVAHFLNMLQ